jgi:hypothetical protein
MGLAGAAVVEHPLALQRDDIARAARPGHLGAEAFVGLARRGPRTGLPPAGKALPRDFVAAHHEPPPVRPPTLPPDFPDISQNPSSELQPPPDPSASADKVAGSTPAPAEPGTPEATIKDELRRRNARLREKINSVLEQHPELRDATDEIALKQGTRVQVGTPFLKRIQANLQERARAIIERRPDLEHLFDD